MKRVKIPKYQVKALDEAIEKYKRLIKTKTFVEFRELQKDDCSLCVIVDEECHRCVYGKATGKDKGETCTKSWNNMHFAAYFKDKIKWAKQILKELRWIKRYQL